MMLLLQYKQTPLLLSSMSGDVDTVNVLLSHEAYIDIKDGAVSNYVFCNNVNFIMFVYYSNCAS